MKKALLYFLIVCMLLSATGCSLQEVLDTPLVKPTEAVFSIDSYALQITADSSFRENTGGSFDLQLTNDNAYVSVMAFKYIDLSEDLTPMKVYEMQNEEIFNRRESVKEIDENKAPTLSGNAVKTALYSAEKDGTKNYYTTYLVDFPDKEIFAWVLVTSMPSYLTENREYLHNIVCSLSPIE